MSDCIGFGLISRRPIVLPLRKSRTRGRAQSQGRNEQGGGRDNQDIRCCGLGRWVGSRNAEKGLRRVSTCVKAEAARAPNSLEQKGREAHFRSSPQRRQVQAAIPKPSRGGAPELWNLYDYNLSCVLASLGAPAGCSMPRQPSAKRKSFKFAAHSESPRRPPSVHLVAFIETLWKLSKLSETFRLAICLARLVRKSKCVEAPARRKSSLMTSGNS